MWRPSETVEKTPGVIRGCSPLWLYSDLATCAANPRKPLRSKAFPAFGAGRAIGASTE